MTLGYSLLITHEQVDGVGTKFGISVGVVIHESPYKIV